MSAGCPTPRWSWALALAGAMIANLSGCSVERSGLAPPDAGPEPPMDAGDDASDAHLDVQSPLDSGCEEGTRTCTDGIETRCVGGELRNRECELGVCSSDSPTRCAQLVPSNVAADMFDDGAPSVTVTGMQEVDTTACDGVLGPGTTVSQGDEEPELCVVAVSGLVIDEEAELRGRGDRPLVILSTGSVTIAGTLDVSARGTVPGAGGGTGATEADPVAGGPSGGGEGSVSGRFDGAGGGGGLCGAGGNGGDGRDAVGGTGGPPLTDWPLVPLRAGSGGGVGAPDSPDDLGPGGSGGGAVQVTARSSIDVSGAILAGGGGGRASPLAGPGGGGGSGGAILLEGTGLEVSEEALLVAAGGGGGGGSQDMPGEPGQDGRSLGLGERAQGGVGFGTGDRGGDGGGAGVIDGDPGGSEQNNGGGGGGGAGCIFLRIPGGAPGADQANPSTAPGFRTGMVSTD